MLVKTWFKRVSDLLVHGVGLVSVTGDQFKPSTIKSAATVAAGARGCRSSAGGPLVVRC